MIVVLFCPGWNRPELDKPSMFMIEID